MALGLALLAFAILSATIPAPAVASVTSGALSQLTGAANCIGEEVEASEGKTCGTLVHEGTHDVFGVQLSPDGRSAYSVAINGDLIEYSRNPINGKLAVIGCVTAGTDECAPENVIENAVEIGKPSAVAVSPNGENVYVTGTTKHAVVEFQRDTGSGLLTSMNSGKACVTEEATGECEFKNAKGLNEPYGITVSPDGESVYVAAVKGEALAELARNTSTGVLEPLSGGHECIGGATSGCAIHTAIGMFEPVGVVVSPDGKDVYVAAGAGSAEGAVVAFKRETGGTLVQLPGEEGCISEKVAGCTPATALRGSEDLAISPDGSNVYATSGPKNALVELKRNETTGALEQLAGENECVTTETIPGCTKVVSVGLTRGVAISPDGENVYVGSASENGVAAFARGAEGALTQLPKAAECVTSKASGCEGSNKLLGLEEARRVVVSPDGTNVYVAGQKAGAIVELARMMTPTVTSLSSGGGPYEGGNEITIEGTGFIEGATVEFAGVGAASNVHVDSASTITAVAPPGHVTAFVRVSTSSGTSAEGGPSEYVYGRLGGLNINGYCEGLGYHGNGSGPSILLRGGVTGPNYAYENWACVAGSGATALIAFEGPAPSMDNACAVAFPSIPSHSHADDPNSAYSWNCYEGAPPVKSKGGGGGSGPIAKTSAATPPPVLAKTGNVAPVEGSVLVELPRSKTFVPLSTLTQVPFGTTIEATHGKVSVTAAEPGDKTETGVYFGGQFKLTQERNGTVVATLTGGNFAVCPTARERAHRASAGAGASAHAAASGKHSVRKLWTNAHGKFSTKGNYAAGAVQGTEWLTDDLCEGTLIRVTRDKVLVTNLVKHKRVEVKTGHHYLAKAP